LIFLLGDGTTGRGMKKEKKEREKEEKKNEKEKKNGGEK
jgi:hypothetical protein